MKKVLALAGCIATVTPTVVSANAIPENFAGLNLGEIRASSFLNQPFKGVIPLFGNDNSAQILNISLASEAVFNEIGLEKDPVLDSLNFQLTKQNNKPVILISSDKPITLPFLNFILEIQGLEGTVYQDYTVLLDPATKPVETATEVEYMEVPQVANKASNKFHYSDKKNLKYKVKAGDSLSKIAQSHKTRATSLKMMSELIFQKNPRAFIRGNANKIRKGIILRLPSATEISRFELANSNHNSLKSQNQKLKQAKVKKSKPANKKLISTSDTNSTGTYTVLKGDSLSKITKKFATKENSFTKLMNSIYVDNPSAFYNNSRNRLKAGAVLNIPSLVTKQIISEKNNINKVKIAKKQRVEPKEYQIKQGDTLSYITKKMGYSEVPFAKMLKAIYVNNPDAFINGKMTKLSVGSILSIPPLNSLEKRLSNPNTESKVVINSESENATAAEPTASKNTSNATTSELIKRIRELRKELKQRKKSLSDLQKISIQKETLLQEKNVEIKSLNALLTKFERNISPDLLTPAAIKTKLETIEKNDVDSSISSAELSEFQNDLLDKQEETINQLEKIAELRSSISEQDAQITGKKRQTYFNSVDSSALNLSNKNYYYLTMALVLGLLLIRYRRELYSYTYSVINFDQPSYYPLQDGDKYELKEININYHDPKMDNDDTDYILFPEKSEKQEIVIDPKLVEATDENYDVDGVAEHIEEHDQILSELLDDLKNEEESKDTEISSETSPELTEVAEVTENTEAEAEFDNLPNLLKNYEKEPKEEIASASEHHNFPDLLEDTEPTEDKRNPLS